MSAAALLTIMRDGQKVRDQLIDGEAEVGRAEGCVIRLEHRAISRSHAVFRSTDDGVQLERRSDFAPVLVNGSEVTRALLKEGDVVAMGPYLMRVNMMKQQAERREALAQPVPLDAIEPQIQAIQAIQAGEPDQSSEEVAAAAPPVSMDPFPEVGMESLDAPSSPLPDPVPMPEPLPSLEMPDLDSSGSGASQEASSSAAPPVESMLDEKLLPTEPSGSAMPSLGIDTPEMNLSLQSSGHASGLSLGGATIAADPNLSSAPPVSDEIPGFEVASSDSPTKVGTQERLVAKVLIPRGAADTTEYTFEKDDITIGRGKGCDIILNDKKSSRKHCTIRRNGMTFVAIDLDSANGILVNGYRVKERELTGDDRIVIGDTELHFKVLSADYVAQRTKLNGIPPVEASVSNPLQGNSVPMPDMNLALSSGYEQGAYESAPPLGFADASGPTQESGNGLGNVNGVPGIDPIGVNGISTKKRVSYFESLRTGPPRQRIVRTAILLGVVYFLFFDEDPPVQPRSPKTQQTAQDANKKPAKSAKKDPSLADLSPEQLRFVEAQYTLALDLYKNKDYDRALFEVRKIFAVVNNYKTAREVERYALDGKRIIEAAQEEKRKREEEAKLKAQIAELVGKAEDFMEKKKYDEARDVFPEILALDPDNARIQDWSKEIEVWDEQQRLIEMQKKVEEAKNALAWDRLKEGLAFKKKGTCYAAIDTLSKVIEAEAKDARPLKQAKAAIWQCKEMIRSRREPVLEEAKRQEEAGELAQAYKSYKRVTIIDPRHPDAFKGISRIRGVLHDKAKGMYTEAILAENFSDFAMAKKKFQEILNIAPEDDEYYSRASRKLKRFLAAESSSQEESTP